MAAASPAPSTTPVSGLDGTTTNAVCWLFLGLATATLVARLVSRIHLTKHYGIDDSMIILAYVFLIALTIINSVAVHAGAGTHLKDLTLAQRLDTTKWVFILQCLSAWTLAMPKLSVAALLVRVFEPRRWVSILLYSLAILGVVIAFITTIIWTQQCHPIQKIWDRNLLGTCWPRQTAYKVAEFQFAQSVAYDFIYAIYPASILIRLQMSTRRKLGVCANMALGILAGIVGIIKLSRFNLLDKQNQVDATYTQTQVSVEVEIEAALLIIAACIPTSGPVLARVKNLVVSSVTGSSGNSGETRNAYYPPTISQPKPVQRRGEDDLEFGEEIPMTAHAAWPAKAGAEKDLSRVQTRENHTFFDANPSRKSLDAVARSSEAS